MRSDHSSSSGSRGEDGALHGASSARDAVTGAARCASCGALGYNGDHYCACCGEPMLRQCHACGAPMMRPLANYCVRCGASLAEHGSRSQVERRS